MRTFDHIGAMRTYVRAAREDGKKIGFVPTMGALHEGHLTLMRRARADCDVVIASVFVNPMQFAPDEDLKRYPRDLASDSRLAQSAGVDALFTPAVKEIYTPGGQTVVDVPGVAARWEGAARPGHFRGVATVCTKLFNITQPDQAYFGRKDYQQLKVIERLVADLCLPVNIVPVSTVRETGGLAMSSRNVFLQPDERQAATVLYRALQAAEFRFDAGERETRVLESELHSMLRTEPRVCTEYAVVVDSESLEPVERLPNQGVALIAARIGETRLIDSLPLGNRAAKNGAAKLDSPESRLI